MLKNTILAAMISVFAAAGNSENDEGTLGSLIRECSDVYSNKQKGPRHGGLHPRVRIDQATSETLRNRAGSCRFQDDSVAPIQSDEKLPTTERLLSVGCVHGYQKTLNRHLLVARFEFYLNGVLAYEILARYVEHGDAGDLSGWAGVCGRNVSYHDLQADAAVRWLLAKFG